ncbi:uncharacterized protein LOC131954762 [Physella acuta]|uniref:uncharacterized protein LOC131954762 n=1 Tax=Physella acuta TaxID=109671 RepID=UPI0027DD0443|nr:uncharacterized protein LOC131954762 [Physella acuta]
MAGREFVPPSHYDPAIVALEEAVKLSKAPGTAPELADAVQKVRDLVRIREEFTSFTTTKGSEGCQAIYEATTKHDWEKPFEEGKTTWLLRPFMMSGHLEGQFLKSIVSIQKAKRILDIGMFSGYSALSMAEALPADGEVITIDQDEYLKTFVEDLLVKSPHGKKVKIVLGKALDLIEKMSKNKEVFDIIFLDADKSEYIEYFKYAFGQNMLSPGGCVLIDNAYMLGDGYLPNARRDCSRILAETIAADPTLHCVLVPIRDGIFLIRRITDVEGAVA